MKKLTTLFALSLCTIEFFGQFSSPQWEKTLGGSGYDYTKEVEPTSDGGFITIGYSESSDGSVAFNHGSGDCWIIKFDAAGTMQWEKTFGGSGFDYGYSVIQCTDGGFIAAGYSESIDGDLTANHGGGDCWIIKLDYAGIIQWQKVYGGNMNDNGQSICQTPDGGYIVAGNTESSDGDVTVSYGYGDCWILKLDNAGTIEWSRTLGGSAYDYAQCIRTVAGGGYVFCGGTHSNDLDVSVQKGNGDCWVVKLDNFGNLIWEHSFGGSEYDFAQVATQAADGGFVLAGYSESNNGDVSGSRGGGDCWVLKFDDAGNVIWQKSLGSNGNDYAYCICENSDGTYVMSGYSEYSNGDVSGNHGNYDCWVLMLTESGDVSFQRSLGGTALDVGYSVCRVLSGSFVIAGYSQSDDGDVAVNHGGGDSWVLKLNASYSGVEEHQEQLISVAPNPSNGSFNFSGLSQESVLEVYDAAGRLVLEQRVEGFVQHVNLEEQSKGIYFFRVLHRDDKVVTGKLILN